MKKRLLLGFAALCSAFSGYALEQGEFVYTPQGRFQITGANVASSNFSDFTGWTVVTATEGKTLAEFEGHYLFSIDDTAFFLDDSSAAKTSGATAHAGYEYMGNRTFRSMDPVERLGGATAAHIAHWESQNKFCGVCGNVTIRGDKERSIVCPKCGNVVYPRISPVVIVAVRNGDKLLMAHNIDNPNPRLFLMVTSF